MLAYVNSRDLEQSWGDGQFFRFESFNAKNFVVAKSSPQLIGNHLCPQFNFGLSLQR